VPEVLALDLRGHGASGRSPDGSYDWQDFAGDVLEVVDRLGLDGGRDAAPGARRGQAAGGSGLVGVGHSAGASTLLLAEAERPGTFSRLWAWEPIMRNPVSGRGADLGNPLAQRARGRRAEFGSVTEARAHLAGRGIFAEFTADSFEAFLSGAFVPAGAGRPGT
jgi:alpha-beta hydrolase superfamily lysophospholipase